MSFKIDSKQANASVEFDFTDGAKVTLRPLSRLAMREILKQTTTKKAIVHEGRVVKDEKGGIIKEEITDNYLFQDLYVDYCIVSWSGFEDGGKPFPCIKENKLYLYLNSDEFRLFVDKAIIDLTKADEVAEKDAEKNL